MKTMRVPVASLVLALLSLVLLGGASEASAFECPRPEVAAPGVLQETKADQQRLAELFVGGNIDSDIGVATADLQRKYPQATDSELVNYLIGAYCPVVAQMPGLSDAQRTARVEHFAATLFEFLSEQKR
ncbi:MAG: hypothetical protein U1E42_03390 [Rhodospirillales bacterium]